MGSDHAFLWRAREQELHILAGWLPSHGLILILSFHSNISPCKDVQADCPHLFFVMLLINSIHSINEIECPKRIAYRWHVPHSELSVLCGNSINLLLFDQSYCWSLPAVIVFINKITVVIIIIIVRTFLANMTGIVDWVCENISENSVSSVSLLESILFAASTCASS